jgi:hypothetical protein
LRLSPDVVVSPTQTSESAIFEVEFRNIRARTEPVNLILQLLVTILIIGIIYFFARSESQDWYEKWPAIDDDEFVMRCPSGTSRDVALRVRRIVSEQTGIEYEHIHPDQNFVYDLDCC